MALKTQRTDPVRRVMWFRRDLRIHDHPALNQAAAGGAVVVPLFVVDPALWGPSGPARRAHLAASLAELNQACQGRLVVRTGDPVSVVLDVVRAAGASSVHVSADAGVYGRRRDAHVAKTLGAHDVAWAPVGTPYAIGPGILQNGSGKPYQVFTPFRRAWLAHGWPQPAAPVAVQWAQGLASDSVVGLREHAGHLPPWSGPAPGERAARAHWAKFLGAIDDYADGRDRPDRLATSRLSAALKFGEIHPRTLLADLGRRSGPGAELFRSEVCWREFYADVLWHQPQSARAYLRSEYARMRYDHPERSATAAQRLEAWRTGRTGYPFVDAGIRQLLREGWMHNRVRMVTASFLVKHLHLEWQHGARFFMQQLRDGDLASNSHGWQWTAGSGTDAAPYFRIFNPITQGLRFDPDGDYVRRYVPELAHIEGRAVHRPWDRRDGLAHGYPERIVDLAEERAEALTRLSEITADKA